MWLPCSKYHMFRVVGRSSIGPLSAPFWLNLGLLWEPLGTKMAPDVTFLALWAAIESKKKAPTKKIKKTEGVGRVVWGGPAECAAALGDQGGAELSALSSTPCGPPFAGSAGAGGLNTPSGGTPPAPHFAHCRVVCANCGGNARGWTNFLG